MSEISASCQSGNGNSNNESAKKKQKNAEEILCKNICAYLDNYHSKSFVVIYTLSCIVVLFLCCGLVISLYSILNTPKDNNKDNILLCIILICIITIIIIIWFIYKLIISSREERKRMLFVVNEFRKNVADEIQVIKKEIELLNTKK